MPLMRRQLLKMTLRTEQARTMVFQTAQALAAADRGVAGSASLARILTPLIKFRACRDARGVTGDAMEIRGGCGYIEEWSDARLLRDAHLGSIWEGTSNIVALDVLRAIRRDDALPALRAHVDALLAGGAPAASADAPPEARAVGRAFGLAADAAAHDRAELARQVASALYHVVSMAGLRWEARQARLPQRAWLAGAVLRHRLAPRDPLAATDDEHDPETAALLDVR
jgi:acyl-CoA dehydrogenase